MPLDPSWRVALLPILAAGLLLGCTHPSDTGRGGAVQADDGATDGGSGAAGSPAMADGVVQLPESPPRGPFGYSLIATEGGAQLAVEDFATYEECGDCHERQWQELRSLLWRLRLTSRDGSSRAR